ncbi:MAG TPA: asparagine synthase (glutamine-hydrolyzing) [Verrucomicrobiae bacterium]|nr:asparagine synthase (glutamine-hydrolyzing) [Verrucomicrobiae bacterium]
MCGIAGIVRVAEGPRDSILETVGRMRRCLQHRGPDDEGLFVARDGRAAFAHTRLSILDLSPAGHQPMSTADGRYTIVFNGEIYNFMALRRELETAGVPLTSRSDTEVILRLYEREGTACVRRLRGMFAFAIWDDIEKRCFFARDPLGIKPLYFCRSADSLAFASEIRALLNGGAVEGQLGMVGLYGYLTTGTVPEPATMLRGVQMLGAGHWLEWREGRIRSERYWGVSFAPERMGREEAARLAREALVDSLRHHFVSDVPVGIFLSGGLDSTTLLALAAEAGARKVSTYSIAFEEPEWDEGPLARRIAEHFGSRHHEVTITADIGRGWLEEFLDSVDQPTIDGFNTFCVSKVAHQSGAKVVLSGLGGDELFAGYRSFVTLPRVVRWMRATSLAAPLYRAAGAWLEGHSTSSKTRRMGDFLQQGASCGAFYRSFRCVYAHAEAAGLATRLLPYAVAPGRGSRTANPASDETLRDAVSLLELTTYMRNQLLRDSDVMSMRWGLELRVPFVDSALLEKVGRIPASLRLRPGKRMLIEAVPELPSWVLDQPKRGFTFPFERWFEDRWRDLLREAAPPPGVIVDTWYRGWALAVLQHWMRRNGVVAQDDRG